MNYCDCWICMYHERPFKARECPHEHHPHAGGDKEKKRAYLESEAARLNFAEQEKRPKYERKADPFA